MYLIKLLCFIMWPKSFVFKLTGQYYIPQLLYQYSNQTTPPPTTKIINVAPSRHHQLKKNIPNSSPDKKV